MATTTHDESTAQADLRGGTMHVPRSRGALSGIMLLVLGAWGALIPFIGPYFNFSYTPDTAWHWTKGRGWLEVLPGAVAALGGLLSFASAHRAVISLGAWLGVAAGAWFVVGRDLADWLNLGTPGRPAGTSTAIQSVESLLMFSALGALILFFGAIAVGRLSVHSIRDVRAARRRVVKDDRRDRAIRESAYEQGRRDGLGTTGADRTDAARTDPARTDAARTDAARTDAARTDATRTDATTSQTAAPTAQPATAPAAQPATSGQQAATSGQHAAPDYRSTDAPPAPPPPATSR